MNAMFYVSLFSYNSFPFFSTTYVVF